MFRNKKVFIIVELVIVISILATLAMIAVSRFKGYIEEARISRIEDFEIFSSPGKYEYREAFQEQGIYTIISAFNENDSWEYSPLQ